MFLSREIIDGKTQAVVYEEARDAFGFGFENFYESSDVFRAAVANRFFADLEMYSYDEAIKGLRAFGFN